LESIEDEEIVACFKVLWRNFLDRLQNMTHIF
jgi:hypothetical protein